MRRRWLFPGLFVSALSACAHLTIPNTTACTAKGKLAQGGLCAETLTEVTSELSFEDYVAFLEPLEARGGAICQSSKDWGALKSILEQSCRELGDRCTYQKELKSLNASLQRLRLP